MASKTEIANLAISNLGIGKEIANLDTDKSEEANACRRYYETAKIATLADLDWSFATKCAVLNLVEENPTTEWAYSYRYPIDCLSIRRLVSDLRNDTQQSRVKFKVTHDVSGKLIFTDRVNAEIEYTENITNASLHTQEFNLALSYRLSFYIAPRITGGDPFQLQQRMLQFYDFELNQAKKSNINEQVPDLPPDSEIISTRS